MKRRLMGLAVVVALASPVVATGAIADWGVAVQSATVSPDRSVTITWSLGSAGVSVMSVTVDERIVGGLSSRQTRFTTPRLLPGGHTISIEALETVMSNTYLGSSCVTNGHSAYWVCRRTLRASVYVRVPSEATTHCVVPSVVGLHLKEAEARITLAKCSLDAVKRVASERPAGTVLVERPTPKTRLDNGTKISLVVSRGPR